VDFIFVNIVNGRSILLNTEQVLSVALRHGFYDNRHG